jgi:hypothetical protein
MQRDNISSRFMWEIAKQTTEKVVARKATKKEKATTNNKKNNYKTNSAHVTELTNLVEAHSIHDQQPELVGTAAEAAGSSAPLGLVRPPFSLTHSQHPQEWHCTGFLAILVWEADCLLR